MAWHRSGVTAASAVVSLPGGWWMAGSIPADLTQFFYHIVIILQKFAYLHGWPSLLNKEKELDDKSIMLITLFIGVMFGAGSAAKALGEIAEKLAAEVVARLSKETLTKWGIYQIAKEVAKWIGIKLTKEKFAIFLSKLIPLLSGLISGTITWISFSIMSERLRKHLANLRLANE